MYIELKGIKMITELEEAVQKYLKENLKVKIEAKRDWDGNTVYVDVRAFIRDEQISYSETEIEVQDAYVYRG